MPHEAEKESVMVAIMLPKENAHAISMADGVPEDDMHITLAFLGFAQDMNAEEIGALHQSMAEFANLHWSINLTVGHAVGSFPPSESSEGKVPFFSEVKSSELVNLRQALVQTLNDSDVVVDNTFPDYHPHVTIKYLDEGEPLPEACGPSEFEAKRITVKIGPNISNYELLSGATHLSGEICACYQCNFQYFAESCGPGLVSKEIIDRLGRKSKRCVRDGGKKAKSEVNTETLGSIGGEEQFDRKEGESGDDWYARSARESLSKLAGESTIKGVITNISLDKAAAKVRRKIGVGGNKQSKTVKDMFNGKTGYIQAGLRGQSSQDLQLAVTKIMEGSGDRFFSDVEQLNSNLGSSDIAIDPSLVDESRADSVVEELTESIEKERAYWRERLGDGGTMKVYRAVQLDKKPTLGENVVQDLAVSSWTANPTVTARFGNTVMMREITAEDIISSYLGRDFLQTSEAEFMLYTPPDGVSVEIIA